MRVALALGVALLASGCEVFTHSCTAIGCIDSVTLQLRPAGGSFTDGNYTLELVTPAGPSACRFVMPDSLPQQGAVGSIDCDPGILAFVEQDAECSEQRSADSTSESCMPVPGQFALHAQLQGTPDTLEVRIERDDATLIESTLTPTYETSFPNGPDCDPECHNANLVLDVP